MSLPRLPEQPELQLPYAPLLKTYGSLLLMILAANAANTPREDN